MKRFATLALMVCFMAAPIFAAEKEEGGLQIWKWANFLVLAGGLGYLIGKKGGPFFALRAESGKEEQAETGRFGWHTAAEIAKTQAQAEQEIAAAGKAARMELKRYCADLAVGLAEQKVRARMTPETQDALVRGFVRDLK